MLPPSNRLTRSADFGAVVRSGRRAKGDTLVVHLRRGLGGDSAPPVAGFVVSRGVGNSVVRHRVTRRLRAQLGARLELLPPGSGTVVRALPPAASASSAELAADLERALARVATR